MSCRSQNLVVKLRYQAMGLLFGIVFSGIIALAHAQPKSKAHSISIEAMQFAPTPLEVSVGDTVTWKNKDAFPHNATAENKGFASGDIQSGQSWKFKAGKKGVFPYICTLHPNMKAVLIVK